MCSSIVLDSGTVCCSASSTCGVANSWPAQYASKSALMMASREGHLEMVLLLLEFGADVNYTSAFGYNALNTALDRGRRDVAEVLIRAGAKR